MANTGSKLTFTRTRDDDGDLIEDSYDVYDGGVFVGEVQRTSTPRGYWGAWRSGDLAGETRTEVASTMLSRWARRFSAQCAA